MSPSSADDVDPVREVRRLHLVLDDWYAGIRDALEPLEVALADDFTVTTPDGELTDPQGYFDAITAEREAATEAGERIALNVDEIEHQRAIYGLHHVTYRETQTRAGSEDRWRCSVWMRETDRVSTGIQWLHLQKTPIPAENAPDEAE